MISMTASTPATAMAAASRRQRMRLKARMSLNPSGRLRRRLRVEVRDVDVDVDHLQTAELPDGVHHLAADLRGDLPDRLRVFDRDGDGDRDNGAIDLRGGTG